jgi:hypothetical protein
LEGFQTLSFPFLLKSCAADSAADVEAVCAAYADIWRGTQHEEHPKVAFPPGLAGIHHIGAAVLVTQSSWNTNLAFPAHVVVPSIKKVLSQEERQVIQGVLMGVMC